MNRRLRALGETVLRVHDLEAVRRFYDGIAFLKGLR
jgi:hypothetical protein